MKNIMLTAAILAAFTITSCKKADRVCECTTDSGTTKITYTDKTTKAGAKALCEGFNYKDDEGSGNTGEETDCKLK